MEAEFAELIHTSRGMLSANEASELLEFIQAGQHALAIEVLDGVDPYALESVRAVVRYQPVQDLG